MKWIKKNKFTCIAVVVFIVMAIVGYKVIKVFFPDTKSAIYGDRLDGKVKVEKGVYDAVKAKISEKEFVKSVKVKENGKTINIEVVVLDSTSHDAAKSLSKLVLEHFSDIQVSYYDFQIFISKESEEENDFPIIAYKQHNKSEFSWTKDREKVIPEATTETKEKEG